jgi:hypothetical protein
VNPRTVRSVFALLCAAAMAATGWSCLRGRVELSPPDLATPAAEGPSTRQRVRSTAPAASVPELSGVEPSPASGDLSAEGVAKTVARILAVVRRNRESRPGPETLTALFQLLSAADGEDLRTAVRDLAITLADGWDDLPDRVTLCALAYRLAGLPPPRHRPFEFVTVAGYWVLAETPSDPSFFGEFFGHPERIQAVVEGELRPPPRTAPDPELLLQTVLAHPERLLPHALGELSQRIVVAAVAHALGERPDCVERVHGLPALGAEQ